MLLTRLKDETRELHERVERNLALLERAPSADEYRPLLWKFYRFYRPAEAALAAVPWGALGFDFDSRRKAPLLERDLTALGATRAALDGAGGAALPPLDTVPRALGCLYVLEGATLGGQVLTRHMSGAPGGPLPGAFFASYGADVGTMWKTFRAFLTAYSERAGGDDEIVRSAHRTFEALGAVLAGENRP
ncbi:MAG TPA: biliverdin-producing heme oxygenase [Gemmata sp.]